MPLDQGLLKGTQSREWIIAKPPTGAIPQWVYTGRDESGLGPIYVALAAISAPPSRETMRALHAAYKGKSNIQLVVGAVLGNQVWIFGPDEKTEVTEPLVLDQGCRQLQSALDEPDAIAAYTRLGQFRRSLDTTSLVGVTNSGLFASYHIRENVPKRIDWKESCEKAKPLLALRNEHLIKALGFKSEKTAGNALLLTTGTPQSKAVAILLDETEQFDATSARHTGISPVAFGLNIAARQGVPWLFVLRKDQIRIYPAKDGVGVGQKGQVETYLEIDLAAIDSERAGLLTLIFSADALEPNGTANDLLQGSQLFASQLGSRLRERIYEHVVPQLSKSVAEHLRIQGTILDSKGLTLAYRLSLKILFRLLFQAYAEDRGLLPAGRNEGYDSNSLKTIAKRIINTPVEQFGNSKTLWFDLVQVWDAIDEGNETWNVPAYNGGLFGKDPSIYPEGALIEKLGIHDDVLGPVLQHLLLDISEDNILGPVDFRSLSVREFGTIYEGLLESSLSVAAEDLTVDSNGAWIPATKTDQVLAYAGEVYFHSASGERKATGSYFTPSIVVDHLIQSSLDPALDVHLAKIKDLLEAGDEAKAARQFFDFRVADLAMGSGHFLVAAVDRIEARMRTFLAEKETKVPGINAELHRLAQTAKSALGNDESAIGEIEPAALLRRQIARRCIYGLDVNPLAVELARLALWIHTFVPGLPMSSLDHGLVCANSLTGIGTIEEALSELSGQESTGQISFFESAITDNLMQAKGILIDVAASDEASKSDVTKSILTLGQTKKYLDDARIMFDAAVAVRLGLIDSRVLYDEITTREQVDRLEVSRVVEGLNCAHMPILFPEVFLRDFPGFDVILGNPPWEKIKVEEHQWWAARLPGLRGLAMQERNESLNSFKESRPDLCAEFNETVEITEQYRKIISSGPYPGIGSGDVDLFQAFAWRIYKCSSKNGRVGILLPRASLTGSGMRLWREELYKTKSFENICLMTNMNEWIFQNVHARYTVAAISLKLNGTDKDVTISGPHNSVSEFLNRENLELRVNLDLLIGWSDSYLFPALESRESSAIYLKMKKFMPISAFANAGFRPNKELDETNDKSFFDTDLGNPVSDIPVYAGKTFNIWENNFGSVYAYAKDSAFGRVFEKITNSSRQSRSAFSGMGIDSVELLPAMAPRIAYRRISRVTDSRTVIACLVPPRVLLVTTAPYFVNRFRNFKAEAFLLGVLCSIPFDWHVRRSSELDLTIELLTSMPIPEYDSSDVRCVELASLAASLAATDARFDAWAKANNVPVAEIFSATQKAQIIARIDRLVGELFGLEDSDLRHMFQTFQSSWNYEERLNLVLKSSERLALNVE
jgi:hypothetical protein